MIDIQQYRAVIRCFMFNSMTLSKYTGDLLYKAGKKNAAYDIFRNCMHIVLLFVVLILLMAGDIQSNQAQQLENVPNVVL